MGCDPGKILLCICSNNILCSRSLVISALSITAGNAGCQVGALNCIIKKWNERRRLIAIREHSIITRAIGFKISVFGMKFCSRDAYTYSGSFKNPIMSRVIPALS
jgi:hypothetical protein